MNAKIKQQVTAMVAAISTTATLTGSVLGGFNMVATSAEALAATRTTIIASASNTAVEITAVCA